MTDNLETRVDTLELIVGELLNELVECKLALQGAEKQMALGNATTGTFRQFQDAQRGLQSLQTQLGKVQAQAQASAQLAQANSQFQAQATADWQGPTSIGNIVTDALANAPAPQPSKSWWHR